MSGPAVVRMPRAAIVRSYVMNNATAQMKKDSQYSRYFYNSVLHRTLKVVKYLILHIPPAFFTLKEIIVAPWCVDPDAEIYICTLQWAISRACGRADRVYAKLTVIIPERTTQIQE